jgi:hypothetical protein
VDTDPIVDLRFEANQKDKACKLIAKNSPADPWSALLRHLQHGRHFFELPRPGHCCQKSIHQAGEVNLKS